MDRPAVLWVALVLSSVATGFFVVGVLVARRRTESLVGLAAMASFGATAAAIVAIANVFHRADAVFYSAAFTLGGIAGGYALASSLLFRLIESPGRATVPSRTDAPVAATAVFLLAWVESRAYDPRETAAVLNELAEEDVIDVSIGLTPLLFFAQKTRYRAVGDENPAYVTLGDLSERLGAVMGAQAHVSWATCSGPNSLLKRVLQAYRQGYRKFVVVPLAVAEALEMTTAIQEVQALHLEENGGSLSAAGTLSDSDRLMSMIVSRVTTASDSPDVTGVVLVGHGQPEGRAHRDPGFDEEEIGFLSRLRVLLIDRGYTEKNVRVAWIDWRSPDVTGVVRHLAALGCRRLVIVPAVWPLDTLSTRLDLELAARQARVDETVSVITLPAWGLDDALVEELRVRAVQAMGNPK